LDPEGSMEARGAEGTKQTGPSDGGAVAGELRLRLEAEMPAPRPRVFALLTEPWEVARWWGPSGFEIPSIDSDPSVGGRFRIAMQPPDGDLFHLQGEFLELDPPALVSYTFRWEEPDPDDIENVATLRLEDLGESTRLTVEHGPFATQARRDLHEQGWTESLEKLRQLLAGLD
jgi:uncharacterized protein YndB with AHSA1/START domain